MFKKVASAHAVGVDEAGMQRLIGLIEAGTLKATACHVDKGDLGPVKKMAVVREQLIIELGDGTKLEFDAYARTMGPYAGVVAAECTYSRDGVYPGRLQGKEVPYVLQINTGGQTTDGMGSLELPPHIPTLQITLDGSAEYNRPFIEAYRAEERAAEEQRRTADEARHAEQLAVRAAEDAALAALVEKLTGAIVETVASNDGKVLSLVLRTRNGELMVVKGTPGGGLTVKSRDAS